MPEEQTLLRDSCDIYALQEAKLEMQKKQLTEENLCPCCEIGHMTKVLYPFTDGTTDIYEECDFCGPIAEMEQDWEDICYEQLCNDGVI